MPKQFIETDQGFINVRFIMRIWWDKEADGWMLEHIAHGATTPAHPKEDDVAELLGLEE